ncbi:MAG: hypothetical protein ACR2LN_04090 [Candidatus Levyibacteriota bacterium]
MKYVAGSYSLIAVTVLLFLPRVAFADVNASVSGNAGDSNVSVDSQSQGQSTTCINGQCTTSGGGSHATVCVNGKCTTSDSGNIDVQSDDGHSQVHISNDTSTTPSPQPTNRPSVITPSLTPDPTIMQMRKDLNNKVKQQTEAVKDRMKNQEKAISKFFKSEMDTLNDLFKGIFK